MTTWMPIETAPEQEGVPILAWNGDDVCVVEWAFDGYEWGFRHQAFYVGRDGGSSGWVFVFPEITHWHVLPKPPAALGDQP